MTAFQVSLLTFRLSQPEDGYPIYEDWTCLAQDIFHAGYEDHRAVVEVYISASVAEEEPLGYGSLRPNKGFTRLSVLFFGLLYTYKELSQHMGEPEQDDFNRRG